MSKSVIEYTFNGYEKLVSEKQKDGSFKLVTKKFDPITLHFSLLHHGHSLFEQEYGKSVMSALAGNANDNAIVAEKNLTKELLSAEFIQALACASYIKVDPQTGAMHNNALTIKEFKAMPIYSQITNDFVFIGKLNEMLMDCLPKNEEKKSNNNGNKNKRKKR